MLLSSDKSDGSHLLHDLELVEFFRLTTLGILAVNVKQGEGRETVIYKMSDRYNEWYNEYKEWQILNTAWELPENW